MSTFSPALLRLAREQKGLTQSELAEQLSVRQAVLSKYENGAIVPSMEIIQKLADCLHYPASFFQQDIDEVPSGLVFHRKRSSLTALIRTKLEAEVKLRTLDARFLFSENELHSELLSRDGRTPEEMAVALREHWKMAPGPISNMIALLEAHNIVVIQFDFDTEKLDGFFVPLQDDLICIALNSNPCFSTDRQRFSLAHELGHAVLHRDEFPDESTEDEADTFAAEFLMPTDSIRAELEPPLTFQKLCELKAKWKVSMASLLFRANKLGTISESVYRKMWMFFSAKGLRKHEPECGIELETSNFLKSLAKKYAQKNPEYLEALRLTQEQFKRRYN